MRIMRFHARTHRMASPGMALNQDDLDRLDRAIASQQLEVQFGDRRVRYRTMDELLAARQHVASQIAAAKPCARATRRYTFTTLRGD